MALSSWNFAYATSLLILYFVNYTCFLLHWLITVLQYDVKYLCNNKYTRESRKFMIVVFSTFYNVIEVFVIYSVQI